MVLQEEMRKKPQFTVIYPIRCARIAPFLFMFFFKTGLINARLYRPNTVCRGNVC
jgi:hypothetical protein